MTHTTPSSIFNNQTTTTHSSPHSFINRNPQQLSTSHPPKKPLQHSSSSSPPLFPPSQQTPPFTNQEISTSRLMTSDLRTYNPFRRYPPLGVPCPETFYLGLKQRKWRGWIEWIWGVDATNTVSTSTSTTSGTEMAESQYEDEETEVEEEEKSKAKREEKKCKKETVKSREEKKKEEEYLGLETEVAKEIRRDSLAQGLLVSTSKPGFEAKSHGDIEAEEEESREEGDVPDRQSWTAGDTTEAPTNTDEENRGRRRIRRKTSPTKTQDLQGMQTETRNFSHDFKSSDTREDTLYHDEDDEILYSIPRGEHQSPHPPKASHAARLAEAPNSSPRCEFPGCGTLKPAKRLPRNRRESSGTGHLAHDEAGSVHGDGCEMIEDEIVEGEDDEAVTNEPENHTAEASESNDETTVSKGKHEDDTTQDDNPAKGSMHTHSSSAKHNNDNNDNTSKDSIDIYTSTPTSKPRKGEETEEHDDDDSNHDSSTGFWTNTATWKTTEAQKKFLKLKSRRSC